MRAKLKRAIFYGTWLIRFSCCTIFYLIISIPLRFSKKYKDLWIISERLDEARDNGYWLYKWIIENKPDTNVRYVLAKDSVDYEKMPRKDLIIEPNSAKHYISYILSSYSVSTHMHGACPGKSFCIPFLFLMRRKKSVFLQHGITKDMINLRGGLDIITAASEEEKKLLVRANPRYSGNVFVTGFCRYDQLEDLSEETQPRMILVMPTFRKWLRDIARLKNPDKEFRKTTYYKKWNELLNDEKLGKLLRESNIKLLFFPHKEMQGLAHNFKSKNKSIIIGKPGEYDIQELLRKASILITDYSSVLFDFVYMGKPIVLYQFDKKDFFSKHYSTSGKPYPFGDICEQSSEVADEVISTVERKYKMKKNYADDARKFFKYRDRNNCKRVYNLIVGEKNNE